jgi:oxygen-independent coproporphyrinogen-3 oxidase
MDGEEVLSQDNLLAERVYLGLRTADGLSLETADQEHVSRWLDAGWATLTAGRLALTATGWLRLDSLAIDLTLAGSR